MQFTIVLSSVVLVIVAIWLIGRRVQFSIFNKSGSDKKIFSSSGDQSLSSVALTGRDFTDDGVELGPVIQVDEFTEDSSSLFTEVNSKVDKTQMDTDIDEFGDGSLFSNESRVTAEDEEAVEVEVEESFESQDDVVDQVADSQVDDYENVDDRDIHEGFVKDLVPMEDPEPHFGEYSKNHRKTRFNDSKEKLPRQITKLKIPDTFADSMTGNSTTQNSGEGHPIQAELEVSVVFPDYRGTNEREIDVVGWLPEERGPVKRMDVLTIYRKLDVKMNQPHSIIGLDVNSGKWNSLENDSVTASYSDLIFTMQLSYKGQAVSERDWWKFSLIVENVAQALSRRFHLSVTTDTVFTESQRLNDQIQDLDIQAILILKSNYDGQFSEQGMKYLAREYGLVQRTGTTVFDRADPDSSSSYPLFSVVPMSDANVVLAQELGQDPDMRTMIVFSNLTCVKNPREAFDTMIDVALDLEDRLSAKLVDQNHNPVTNRSIYTIRSQIDEFTGEMIGCGISPGSENAMRLFETSLMVRDWAESQGVVSLKPER